MNRIGRNICGVAVVALLGSTACAQSSVTIYGIIDEGVAKTNSGQSNLTFFPSGTVGRNGAWVVRPATSSRLGFKSTEDLGGGLMANFQIEHRFLPNNGTTEIRDAAAVSNAFWNAASWVGLSSDLGEVRLGRQFLPAFWLAVASDPFGFDYSVAGAAGFTKAGNSISTAYNAVSYRSPTFYNFKTEIMVAAGEGGAAAVLAPAGRSGRDVGANLQYADGPLSAGIGYNDSKQVGTPILNRYLTSMVSYDFGVVRPILSYSVAQNNVATNAKTKAMIVGALAPFGTGQFKAVAARYEAAFGQNFNATNAFLPQLTGGQATTKFGFGYQYFLSKRTSVHADVGTAKTQSLSRTTGFEFGLKQIF